MPLREAEGCTPGEIALAAETEKEKQQAFYQVLAWLCYNAAALTGVAVNDPKQLPTLEDAFPSLFERKEQQDWWVMKERIENFRKNRLPSA